MDKEDINGLIAILIVVAATCLTTFCLYSLMFRSTLNKIDALEISVDEIKNDRFLRSANASERRNDEQR